MGARTGKPGADGYPPEVRQHVIDLLTYTDWHINKIAETAKVSYTLVQMYAKDAGIDIGIRKQKTIKEALVVYDTTQRLRVANLLMAQIEETIPTTRSPGGLRNLAIAFGVMVDKIRLDHGLVTSRTEQITLDAATRIAAMMGISAEELMARAQELADESDARVLGEPAYETVDNGSS